MHNYPLHKPVTVNCPCCKLSVSMVLHSHHDQLVCLRCRRHLADDKAAERDKAHVTLWHAETERTRQAHREGVSRLRTEITARDAKIKELRGEIDELQRAVRDGLGVDELPAVERWLANEQVSAAAAARDRAYKSRDHAYRALWALAQLHQETISNDRCSCGKHRDACNDLAELRRVDSALRRWENTQIDRLRRDEPHGLPYEHPEVLKQGPGYRNPAWPDWEADAG